MKEYQNIERTIIKTYRKEIWSKFSKAVRDYELIEEGDKIMVCVSGGKDSFLLAKCIEEIQKHGKVKFETHYVSMNPGYNDENLECIKENAKKLNVKLEMFESNIFQIADKVGDGKPCYLCARMRRGHLYNKAKELGCNKIALGHHFDDVIETTMLSILYGAEIKTMLPKLHSKNFENLELIRPLYLVKEQDIINWRDYNKLTFINCGCPLTRGCTITGFSSSKRKEVKELIKDLREKNKEVDHNIFKALDNVNLNCILSYTKDGEKHNFLDNY